MLATPAIVSSLIDDQYLMAGYPLDNNINDVLGNYNGSWQLGTGTYNATCQSNGCYNFDEDIIDVGDFSDGLSEMSVSMWLRKNESDVHACPVAKLGSDDKSWTTQIFLNPHTYSDQIYVANYDAGSANSVTTTEEITADETWHHLAWTFNHGNFSVYIDKVKVHMENVSHTTMDNVVANVTIGGNDKNLCNFFGQIDEVYFFNKTLTDGGCAVDDVACTGEIADAYTYSYGGGDPSAITLTNTHRHKLYQRINTTHALVNITGTYTGTIANASASLDGSSWTPIVGTVSGGVINGYAYLPVGQGTMWVRGNDTSTLNDSIEDQSVGDLWLIVGQSNARGKSTYKWSHDSTVPYTPTNYKLNATWVTADDPTRTVGDYGSAWPQLLDYLTNETNVPQSIIAASWGGSSILEWQAGDLNYTSSISQVREATDDNMKIRGIWWYQGEADMATTSNCEGNYSCYYTNFTDMITRYDEDLKLIDGFYYSTTTRRGSPYTSTSINNIRQAQKDTSTHNNVSGYFHNYDIDHSDDYHMTTRAAMGEFSKRWQQMVSYESYGLGIGITPTITSVVRTNDTTLNITFSRVIQVRDYEGGTGTPLGFNLGSGLNDADVVAVDYVLGGENTNDVIVVFDQNITMPNNLSYCSALTCYDDNILADNASNLPAAQTFEFSITYASVPSAYGNLVLNVTFDDDTQCGYDYSTVHTEFQKQGSADCIEDRDVCKWYGCANLTATSGDYFNDTMNFILTDQFTIAYWVMPIVSPPTTSQGYFFIEGADDDHWMHSEEGDYGLNSQWDAATGVVGGNAGSSKTTSTDTWTHYASTYNGTHYITYKNGVIIDNDNDAFGNLNVTIGDEFQIGRAIYGIDIIGYMDEVLAYNKSLSESEIYDLYDAQRLGTPPELDLIVVNHTITDGMNTLYNFSAENNTLNMTGNVSVEYTIANIGNETEGTTFTTLLVINGFTRCTNSTTIAAQSTLTFDCSFDKAEGLMSGYISVDSRNDIDETLYAGGREDNNIQPVYIDFRPHPKLVPPINISYLSTPGDDPAKDAYTALVNFVSEDFNPGWDTDNVDPRGKKGYENAISCYLSGYDLSDNACTRVRNHLDGWLSLTGWDEGDVQALHELEWVAKTYDVMFNNLTQAEATSYAQNMSRICLEVYGKENVRPDTDSLTVSAGNGKGFGSGMAYPCIAVLGEVDDNPSSTYYPGDSSDTYNTVDEWYGRIERHIKGNNNDSGFSEGVLYWNYATYHLTGLLWYDSTTSIANISAENQGDLCGRAKVALYYYQDNTYDGNTLRGDNSANARWVSFGDTHAYDYVGEMEITGASMVTGLGIVCDNQTIKDGLFSVRDRMYYQGSYNAYERPLESMYYYKTLVDTATNRSEAWLSNNFYTETEIGWEKHILRDGYTYSNDTIIYFDGGDKPGFGHPNAEFDLTVYAMGEPFLDQPQVPYEDDVRTERWHNTVSLSNSTVAGYATDPYNPVLHQPYGGATNPDLVDYPTGTFMPTDVKGQLDSYYGLPSLIGGASLSQPYNSSSTMFRQFMVYEDVILDRFEVDRDGSGLIQYNWLNIYEEFSPTIGSDWIEWERLGTNKRYNISILLSDSALTIEGGNSTVRASKQKTGSADLDVFYGHYRFYNEASEGTTSLFMHHWYENDDDDTIVSISDGDDTGVKINSAVDMLMDLDSDGITWGIYETDAWGLILNSTHIMVHNATYVDNGTGSLSLPYTPYSGALLLGVAPDADLEDPVITNLVFTDVLTTRQRITFNTDNEPFGANRTINYGNTTALGTIDEFVGYTTDHNELLTGLMPNTTYYVNITVCDGSANCATNGTYNFTTAEPGSSIPSSIPNLIPGLVGFIIAIIAVSLMGLIYNTVEGEGWKNPGALVLLTVVVVTVLIGIVVIASTL